MKSWRDLGYVPASDGEDDSDAELSTQEDDVLPDPAHEREPERQSAQPTAIPAKDAMPGPFAVSGDSRKHRGEQDDRGHRHRTDSQAGQAQVTSAIARHASLEPAAEDDGANPAGGARNRAVADFANDDVRLSVEHGSKAAQEHNDQVKNETLYVTGESNEDLQKGDDDFMDVDEILGGVATSGRAKGKQIPKSKQAIGELDIRTLDLSSGYDEAEKEAGGIELEANYSTDGAAIRTRTPPPKQPERRSISPDPITGEAQYAEELQPSLHRTPPQIPDTSSAVSSPLSSAPSRSVTPPSSVHPQAVLPAQLLEGQEEFPSSSIPLAPLALASSSPAPAASAAPLQAISEALYAPVRNLRQRKPIQEHPYLLERERYRRELQSHGVKPVRIEENQEEASRRRAAEADSQDKEYEAPLERDDSRPRRRRPSGSVSRSPRLLEDFPDGGQLRERTHVNDAVANGPKRRKTAHAYSKRSSRELQRSNNPTTTKPVSDRPNIYDFRESPSPAGPSNPNARKSQSSGKKAISKPAAPHKVSADEVLGHLGLAPPSSDSGPSEDESSPPPSSPVLSHRPPAFLASSPVPDSSPPVTQRPRRRSVTPMSDPPKHQPRRRSITPMSDPPRHQPTPVLIASSSVSPSASSISNSGSSSEENSPDIRKLQRKTNGVLPASWWKLDKKKIDSVAKQRERDARRSSTPVDVFRPGLARTKLSHRPRVASQDIFFGDSDSDDESVIIEAPQASGRQRSTEAGSVIDLSREGEAEEDNQFDRMLPSVSRRTTAGGAKKKQGGGGSSSRVGQGDSRRSGTGSSAPKAPRRYRQPRLPESMRTAPKKKAKRVSSGPRIGIHDAARHHRQSTQQSPPRFIKVAARQARARGERGRGSPARKLFVLDSAHDTHEVQALLHDWREGTLPFRPDTHEYGVPARPPHSSTPQSGPQSSTQPRFPSPQRLGDGVAGPSRNIGRSVTGVTRIPGLMRQTDLRNYRTRPATEKNHAPRKRAIQKKPLAIIPSKPGVITHRPTFAPQSAQFERVVPATYRAIRPPQYNTRLKSLDILESGYRERNSQQPWLNGPPISNLEGEFGLSVPLRPAPPKPTQPVSATAEPSVTALRRRLRRKNTPQRIEVNTIERRQPPTEDIAPSDDEPVLPIVYNHLPEKPGLTGLLPYGAKYSLNFDTAALTDGTRFNAHTLIGQGLLSRALTTPPARVSNIERTITFSFAGERYRWGVYQDSVATDFEKIMTHIEDLADNDFKYAAAVDALRKEAYNFYRVFVDYVADMLSFTDSVDLYSFGQRILQALESCCDRLAVCFGERKADTSDAKVKYAIQANMFGLLVTFQIFRLACTDPELEDKLALRLTFSRIGRQLINRLLKCGFDAVRTCYEEQRQRVNFEHGIGPEHWVVEAWVVAVQILDHVGGDRAFWQTLNQELNLNSLEFSCHIAAFERLWKGVFALLPLNQFDRCGIARGLSSENTLSDNWILVKALVSRPLSMYSSTWKEQGGTANDYCRVLYARCFHLITKWRWPNADTIIPALYELFSKNHLENLKNETDRGSPEFLHRLDTDPSIAVYDSDLCFHLLLKVIVVGVKLIKATVPANKVGRKVAGLVIRLMPNNRRQFPKDKELQVDHLIALRNHHDLLETLYWVAAPENQEPLRAIRLLVDPKLSHRQALNVAVRSWSDLVRFQLHSGEATDRLKPFAEWFDHLVSATLLEHNAARNNAEQLFDAARDLGDIELSRNEVEGNIRRNQRQLEGILNDLIKSLSIALSEIPGQVQGAIVLFTEASTTEILKSFARVSHRLVIEVLSLLQQYVRTCQPTPVTAATQLESNDDSQDYGDWSAIDELLGVDETSGAKTAADHFITTTYDALHQMLSNCFGADRQPEENLLVKTVDTWSVVAGFLVQHGLKSWNTYLEHGAESWSFIRATEQKRKFTAYFMTKIMHAGGDEVYRANQTTFLSYWMQTLVEREAMLKFQHEFTATLLNYDQANPMLENLPFVHGDAGGFTITQTEFRLRRLSIISTILANMRRHYEETLLRSQVEARLVKTMYADMLQAMMQAMRDNYQQLQASMAGEYVNFVHQIVEYLQQYSVELVAVDKFFTDSPSFPLPTGDPAYLIGKLKSYALNRSFPRSHLELIMFVQGVCEKAAWGGGQDYLVNLFATALSGEFESGDPQRPTLRTFFLNAIVPPYVERALASPSGWILALPMLKSLEAVLGNLEADIDSTLYNCVHSVVGMLASTSDAMRRGIEHLMAQSNTLGLHMPTNVAVLTLMFRALACTLPLLDWLSFSSNSLPPALVDVAVESHAFLLRFAAYAARIRSPSPGRAHHEVERPLDTLAGSPRPQEGTVFETARRKMADKLAMQEGSWQQAPDGIAWHHVRPGGRNAVVTPALPEEREFERAVGEVLCVAARTERWEGVVRDVEEDIWRVESRGWPWGDRARSRGRAVEGLGDVFC